MVPLIIDSSGGSAHRAHVPWVAAFLAYCRNDSCSSCQKVSTFEYTAFFVVIALFFSICFDTSKFAVEIRVRKHVLERNQVFLKKNILMFNTFVVFT